MPAFKDPSFTDRTAAAAAAREKALAQLRAKPPVDEAALAAREAKREAKEAAAAEKRAQLRAEREAAAAAKAAARAEAEAAAAAAAAPPPPRVMPTAAEMKAARDARYAARKQRKG